MGFIPSAVTSFLNSHSDLPFETLKDTNGIWFRFHKSCPSSSSSESIHSNLKVEVEYKCFIIQENHTSADGFVLTPVTEDFEHLIFDVSKNTCIPAWDLFFDKNISRIKPGAVIDLLTTAEYAFKDEECESRIPSDSSLLFNIRIIACINAGNSIAEQIENNQHIKNYANSLVNKNPLEAAKLYSEVISNLQYISSLDKIEKDAILALKLVCNLNQALAYLKTKQFQKAVISCNKALYIEPDNIKALYRMAQANRKLLNFEKARRDINKAIRLFPNEKDLKKELQLINDAERISDSNSTKSFKKMGKLFKTAADKEGNEIKKNKDIQII